MHDDAADFTHVADRSVAPPRFDAGLSADAESQLPRTVASPRTGLSPAGCPELVALYVIATPFIHGTSRAVWTHHTRALVGCGRPSGGNPSASGNVLPGRQPCLGEGDVQGDVHPDDSSHGPVPNPRHARRPMLSIGRLGDLRRGGLLPRQGRQQRRRLLPRPGRSTRAMDRSDRRTARARPARSTPRHSGTCSPASRPRGRPRRQARARNAVPATT